MQRRRFSLCRVWIALLVTCGFGCGAAVRPSGGDAHTDASPEALLPDAASGGLYHGWTCPILGCVTTSYNATSPTNQGGSYPYIIGDGDPCRAWKLAATVCATQPTAYGTISPFNNWLCPTAGGFTDPIFGTFCTVNNQYSCSDCYGACNASCVYHPLSLRTCSGGESNQP